MLTRDFLAPYLLSNLDKGRGMIAMLNRSVQVLTWGNHDINDPATSMTFHDINDIPRHQ